MKKRFKVGDHVSWNSEAGRVSGKIIKVHTKDVDYKGYMHRASKDEPQYEIKSNKTDHIAMHKGAGTEDERLRAPGRRFHRAALPRSETVGAEPPYADFYSMIRVAAGF